MYQQAVFIVHDTTIIKDLKLRVRTILKVGFLHLTIFAIIVCIYFLIFLDVIPEWKRTIQQ